MSMNTSFHRILETLICIMWYRYAYALLVLEQLLYIPKRDSISGIHQWHHTGLVGHLTVVYR